jgi:hypothetical protein
MYVAVSHSYFYYTPKPECAIPDDNVRGIMHTHVQLWTRTWAVLCMCMYTSLFMWYMYVGCEIFRDEKETCMHTCTSTCIQIAQIYHYWHACGLCMYVCTIWAFALTYTYVLLWSSLSCNREACSAYWMIPRYVCVRIDVYMCAYVCMHVYMRERKREGSCSEAVWGAAARTAAHIGWYPGMHVYFFFVCVCTSVHVCTYERKRELWSCLRCSSEACSAYWMILRYACIHMYVCVMFSHQWWCVLNVKSLGCVINNILSLCMHVYMRERKREGSCSEAVWGATERTVAHIEKRSLWYSYTYIFICIYMT